jgi:hypothetical protein
MIRKPGAGLGGLAMCERCDEEKEMDRLYEQYGKPLEADHWGEYFVITEHGKALLAPTLDEVLALPHELLGPGSLVMKVGEKAVGRI